MDEWIDIEEASRRMRRTSRQVRRYVERGRVQSRKRGVRVEYLASDIEAIAAELPQDSRPRVESQVMARGEMLTIVDKLQQQLAEAAAREGYLRAQLDQRPALTDTQLMRDELAQVRAERDVLQSRIADLRTGGQRAWIISLLMFVLLAVVIVLFLVLR